ncbi:MAG: GatB/YqeY domain-containing protein [Candidatus Staskawiczbacteria bacterium]|nr:GatB/YqeY domain-containing protein [Candidatus Staskawiczbacteria bacterium]
MLKQNIQNDATKALKDGNQFLVGTLRMLLASIGFKEKEKKFKEKIEGDAQLTDEQVIETISSEIKKRKDAIVLYEKGNRPELADREKKEIEILIKYLPEQLSEDAIKKIVAEAIAKIGAKEMKEMGKVMAEINPKIKGKADGGTVSKIVKELLSK